MTAREAEIQLRWFLMSLFGLLGQFGSFGAFFRHFWPLLTNFGLKLKIIVNWSCDHSKQSRDEQKSDGDGFKWHLNVCKVFLIPAELSAGGVPAQKWLLVTQK